MVQKAITVDEFRTRMRNLPATPPTAHRWNEHCQSIRRHANNENPEEFLKWSTVEGTMYVGDFSITREVYQRLHDDPNWDMWYNTINDPKFGAPTPFEPCPRTSGNYVWQASMLNDFMLLTGIDIRALDSIMEFGGGYGAMCNVARQWGFKGDYHLYDLPEVSLLQEYYLSNIGVEAQFHTLPPKIDVDLVIAISSLSETPPKIRDSFLANVKARYYFIRFQDVFFDVDNHAYLYEWARNNLHNWTLCRTEMKTHWYLVGAK